MKLITYLELVSFVYYHSGNGNEFSQDHPATKTAIPVATSISCLPVSSTGYALYTAFGQPSAELRDPFREHGDQPFVMNDLPARG